MENTNDLFIRLQRQAEQAGRNPDRMSFDALNMRNYQWSVENRTLYVSYFQVLPHHFWIHTIDVAKAHDWFMEQYGAEIWNFHLSNGYDDEGNRKIRDGYYLLFEDLMLYFGFSGDYVMLYYRKTPIDRVGALADEIRKKFGQDFSESSSLYIIENFGGSVDLQRISVSRPEVGLDDNYNDDFYEVHETILRRLSKPNDKGIVLLHGRPGTGKTTYIRYLIGAVRKRVIFLPPNLAEVITDPSLITMMSGYKNSILVIEDAENMVVDRNRGGSSAVSALLNLTDGLLSDCLSIQVICSFNTDVMQIDKALLRKGRLIARYEFRELQPEKANRLAHRLGKQSVYNSPALLTDIYNSEEQEFDLAKRETAVGFKLPRLVLE
jgi:hypothetical protein